MGTVPTAQTRHRWGWFLAWVPVGAGAVLGVLGLLSIGLLVLLATAGYAAFVVGRPSARPGAPGAVSGAGLPLLVVGYLNRGGPGEVCTSTATETSCVDAWNPWWWLSAGLLLLVAGVVVAVAVRRIRPSSGPRPASRRAR